MLQALIAAGVRLSDLLVAENRALSTFDLATAAMIAPEKRRAVEAFSAAEAAVRKAGGQATGRDRDALAAQDAVVRTLTAAATPKPALYGPPGLTPGHAVPPQPMGFAANA